MKAVSLSYTVGIHPPLSKQAVFLFNPCPFLLLLLRLLLPVFSFYLFQSLDSSDLLPRGFLISSHFSKMSSSSDVSPEQLCYIPCNFCNIVLAVSVPCNSLLDTVTVRCGHCTNLWTVNMAAAFHSHSLSSSASSFLRQDAHPHHNYQANSYNNPNHRADNAMGSSSRYYTNKIAMPTAPATNVSTEERVVNRPPEKRQRVPSAYNQFIKEEIQRIKANNPDISHREAFSTAAKNWAHFPHIHFGLMLETNNQSELSEGHDKHLLARTALLK